MRSTEPSGERILFGARRPPPLRPDVAADLPRYQAWQAAMDRTRTARLGAVSFDDPGVEACSICVVLATGRLEPALLRHSLEALKDQGPRYWPLVVAAPRSEWGAVTELVEHWADDRLGGTTRVTIPDDDAPALASLVAEGVVAARADAVLPLEAGDRLAPGALDLLARALAHADLAYADEDEIDEADNLLRPALKPDWSPDLLYSFPYLGRPVVFRRDTLLAAGGVREAPGGDWWHDLLLRVTDRTPRVVHLPEVLCHRPSGARGPDGFGITSGKAAVRDALDRRGEHARVAPGRLAGTWAVLHRRERLPTVSVIVPFRDGARFLRACVDSVHATVSDTDVDLDLLLVDNGSVEPETEALLERLVKRGGFRLRHDPRPFNWAALNNAAIDDSRGEVLVFLNSDIEALRPGWLEALVAQALRPDIGVVGARLLYPGGLLQHAGSVLGLTGAAGHVLNGLPPSRHGYLGMAVLTRDCSAVTGACFAVRRAVFEELGRFDESFARDLNDIDFCLRARAAGYRVVYEAQAELVHHESPIRGTSASVSDQRRFLDRWRSEVEGGDPYLSPHLTRRDPSCALKEEGEDAWWQRWLAALYLAPSD